MFVLRCPYCYRSMELTGDECRARTVKCRHPYCRCFFDTDMAPPESLRSRVCDPEPRRGTYLTSPHACYVCAGPIPVATGMRRCTVLCPACSRRTDVYAVLHRCLCGALLESPLRRAGERERCPTCNRAMLVPRDILQPVGNVLADESWFTFVCPGCAVSVQTPRRLTGNLASCPSCFLSFRVPCHGSPAVVQAAASHDPREAIQRGTLTHCRCGMPIPNRSGHCPYCGTSRV